MSNIAITSLAEFGDGKPLGFIYVESSDYASGITLNKHQAHKWGAHVIVNLKITPSPARNTFLLTGDAIRLLK